MSTTDWWLEPADTASITAGGTTAHRIAAGREFWIERYGTAALISTRDDQPIENLLRSIAAWADRTSTPIESVYHRRLVTGPGAGDTPSQISGPPAPHRHIVTEHSLLYEVDFSLGYNPGLFLDQRANRAWLATLRPRRLLNTFAYTCAFSLAAAVSGAQTLSVDISKSSLTRGRRNFELNTLPHEGHRFLQDDVQTFLRRLAKRRETFDAIILDPPTFGRGGGKTFRIEQDFPQLLDEALAVASPGASILLSTNCSTWNAGRLLDLVGERLPPGTRTHQAPTLPDFAAGSPSTTLWATLSPAS